jgi:hypothetical protein
VMRPDEAVADVPRHGFRPGDRTQWKLGHGFILAVGNNSITDQASFLPWPS